jgi:addiction module HigA family antidote
MMTCGVVSVSLLQLADGIHVPFQRINELVNGKRGVTPSTSLRLAKFFGLSEEFWMNLQIRWDLYRVKKKEKEILETISQVKVELSVKQP